MKLPKYFESLIAEITAIQAYEVIKNLGNPKVNVFSNGQLFDVCDIVSEDGVCNLKASDVGPFLFWGGPPKRLQYWPGTLHTLLCDRIMDAIQVKGIEAVRTAICQPMRERVRVRL
jgi:hypothetical protein